MNLKSRQQAIGEWAEENFGTEQPDHFPLLGCAEEMGELSTSILKRAQGIDDSEKYDGIVGDEEEMDALADVFIYLMDFCYRAGVDMELVEEWFDPDPREDAENLRSFADQIDVRPDVMLGVFGLYVSYAQLVNAYLESQMGQADVTDEIQPGVLESKVTYFIEYLNLVAHVRNFDFEYAVQEAMDEVLDREWDADIQVE